MFQEHTLKELWELCDKGSVVYIVGAKYIVKEQISKWIWGFGTNSIKWYFQLLVPFKVKSIFSLKLYKFIILGWLWFEFWNRTWDWTIPPPARVIRSNDNGIQEHRGRGRRYFMRHPACPGQVYRCPEGPFESASDYLEEFVIRPIQAIQPLLGWISWAAGSVDGSLEGWTTNRGLEHQGGGTGVSNGRKNRLVAPGNFEITRSVFVYWVIESPWSI